MQQNEGHLKFIYKQLSPHFAQILISIIIVLFSFSNEPIIMPKIVTKIMEGIYKGQNFFIKNSIKYCFIYLVVLFLAEILYLINTILSSKLLPRIQNNTRDYLIDKIFDSDLRKINSESGVELANHLANVISGLSDFVRYAVLLVPIVPFLIISFFLFVKRHIIYGFVYIIWSIIYFLLCMIIKNKVQKFAGAKCSTCAEISNFFVESFKNYSIISFFNIFHIRKNQMESLNQKAFQNHYKYIFWKHMALWLVSLLNFLLSCGLLNYLIIKHWLCGVITPTLAIELIQLNGGFIHKMYTFIRLLPELVSSLGTIKNSLQFIKNFTLVKTLKNDFKIENCDIEINNLYLGYNHNLIIKNLSLSIKNKEKIAIFGFSGIGKSSLLKAMAGLMEIQSGTILMGKKNIESFSLQNISYIPQDSFLFNDSIEWNITLGKTNLNPEVLDLLELNNLIEEKGLDFKIGSNNGLLSGGQKQKVNIARALHQNFNLLLCDEPFSALDNISSSTIISNIFKKYKDKTIIVIDHSFAIKNFVDRVLFFTNNGYFFDTHENLLKNNTYYFNFFTNNVNNKE